jgi:CBS domain-containing membrane protein
MPTHQFSNWLSRFTPASLNIPPKEWLRASFGALLGVLIAGLLCREVFGSNVALHLLGPVAASAVLLFAVYSGALAQPWSIVGSYLVATLVALVVVHVLGRSVFSACLAVGLSLAIMCPLRCLHPPSGGLALSLVLADGSFGEMGVQVIYPVMLSAVSLLGMALLYNNLTGVRYPKRHAAPQDLHHTLDPSPEQRVGINSRDLDQALEEIGEFVDVTREDLEQIILATEKHAVRRSLGNIAAQHVMSRDVQCATPQTTLEHALNLFTRHHLKTLPVLNEDRHLVGIVSLVDLIGHPLTRRPWSWRGLLGLRRQETLENVMSRPVTCVQGSAHIVDLIPLLSSQGLHCLPVLEGDELVGVITQTDLIAALHRHLVTHADDAQIIGSQRWDQSPSVLTTSRNKSKDLWSAAESRSRE